MPHQKKKRVDGDNDFQDTLAQAAVLFSVLIAPILGIWFETPFKFPPINSDVIEKALISLSWILVIAFLYYRRKINRIYQKLYH